MPAPSSPRTPEDEARPQAPSPKHLVKVLLVARTFCRVWGDSAGVWGCPSPLHPLPAVPGGEGSGAVPPQRRFGEVPTKKKGGKTKPAAPGQQQEDLGTAPPSLWSYPEYRSPSQSTGEGELGAELDFLPYFLTPSALNKDVATCVASPVCS